MKKYEAHINEDSFGSMIPENWEAAAAYLNDLIDALPEDENGEIDREEVDAIWEAYCHGDYDEDIGEGRCGVDLCELTHQESGIVWYPDDTVFVGNWRDVTIAAELVRSEHYDRFDDQADINGAREVIDDNGDLRDGTAIADNGMMYELSDETVIFAPHGWN